MICLNFRDQNLSAVVVFRISQKQRGLIVGWTLQDSRPKSLGSCLDFERLENKTVEQLFELPMTQDQNLRAVVWTSQDPKCWAVVRTSRDLKCWEVVEFRKTKKLCLCWNSHDQKCWAVVWTSRYSKPKPLSSCLILPWLKTKMIKKVGQSFEFPGPKVLES